MPEFSNWLLAPVMSSRAPVAAKVVVSVSPISMTSGTPVEPASAEVYLAM